MGKRVLAILAVALVAAVMAGACGGGSVEPTATADDSLAKVQAAGVITNGMNPEFAPFEYVEGGKTIGFDIDMAQELGKELGVTVKTESFSFDGLIPALAARKVDMVFSALTITPERAKNVAFSDSYFRATLSLVVRGDETDLTSADALPGKKIGVQLGTTGDLVASDIKGVKVVRFQQLATPFIELKNGKVDGVIIDTTFADLYVQKNPGLKVVSTDFPDEDYGVCVHLGDKTLLQAINDALGRIKASGTYDKLLKKWDLVSAPI